MTLAMTSNEFGRHFSPIPRFDRVVLSGKNILEFPATHRIFANLKKLNLADLPTTPSELDVIDPGTESQKLAFEAPFQAAPRNHPVVLGKRTLMLTTSPGATIKQCPGTNNMLCCHYHIINMVSNCPFDCSYCYLQTYLNQPLSTFFVNEDEIFEQVRNICARPPVAQLRIGTGELADSLAFDPITEFSAGLARVMAPYANVQLELKTKSKNVDHLLHLPKRDHVVIGWSINPQEIISREEHGTANLNERLAAAARAAEAGFGLAFHFDPMIYIEGWKDLYAATARQLLTTVPQQSIRWISIGGLRYQPQLKPMVQRRRPESILLTEETVTSDDGKVRYLRPMRTEMFQFLNETIKSIAPDVYTYLCMESKPVWEKALGRLPDRGF